MRLGICWFDSSRTQNDEVFMLISYRHNAFCVVQIMFFELGRK